MNGPKNFSSTAGWRKKNGALLKFLSGVIAFSLFLVILNLFNSQVKNYFYLASYPIERKFWLAGQSTENFLNSMLKAGSLAKENEDLRNDNQRLLSQIIFLQSVKIGGETQNEASLVYQDSGFELVMAGVIGLNERDELTINKGSDDGISDGMPVINHQNVMFGKISKVYKNFSKVTLISSKDSVISVKIQKNQDDNLAQKTINGVVRGGGGLSAFLDLVPIDDFIDRGDVLATSSLEETFPKDLLVGRIISVRKNDQEPHQQAEVQLFWNIGTDNLFVITNYKR